MVEVVNDSGDFVASAAAAAVVVFNASLQQYKYSYTRVVHIIIISQDSSRRLLLAISLDRPRLCRRRRGRHRLRLHEWRVPPRAEPGYRVGEGRRDDCPHLRPRARPQLRVGARRRRRRRRVQRPVRTICVACPLTVVFFFYRYTTKLIFFAFLSGTS